MFDGYDLPKGVTECDIGDMRISFIDANEDCEYNGAIPHFHSAFELQYVKRGRVFLKNNVKTLALSEGEFIILPPNFFHRTEIKENTERYALLFYILPKSNNSGSFSEYEHYSSLLDGIDDAILGNNPEIAQIIKKICDVEDDIAKTHKLKIILPMLFLLLTDVVKNSAQVKNTTVSKNARRKSSRAALRGMIDDYISLNYADDSLVEKTANLINMSRRNTARVVNELFGMSLSELIVRQRMNCALSFITESNMPLLEIAGKVGYNSYSAFYKAFIKFYGSSPESYRV